MPHAVIVSAVRTAQGRAPRGALAAVRPDDLAAHVLAAALQRAPGVEAASVEDVLLGCALPEAEQGLNVARIAALRAGLPDSVPAMTVNRFCASSLTTVCLAADRIATGAAHAMLAGGVESMSRLPMTGHVLRPNPTLAETMPQAYMGMGLTAERVARRFGVSREDQDAWALRSHERALAAIDAGRFADEIAPLPLGEQEFAVDEGPRRDTSAAALAALRPAFKQGGSVTAGNASQTTDGAAAALLLSEERAAALGLAVLGRLTGWAVAGVAPEVMGLGPIEAVPRALVRAGRRPDEVDLWEVNEAFAAQVLPVAEQLGIPHERLNVNGGAIALGHPLGATGARLVATLLHELARRQLRVGVVSLCVGGGMGMAAVLERD